MPCDTCFKTHIFEKPYANVHIKSHYLSNSKCTNGGLNTTQVIPKLVSVSRHIKYYQPENTWYLLHACFRSFTLDTQVNLNNTNLHLLSRFTKHIYP